MRRSKPIDKQGSRTLDVKRLTELEYENSLLKLLYTDLLQKFSALKDGFIRSGGAARQRECQPTGGDASPCGSGGYCGSS